MTDIKALKDKYKGKEIWIIGSGPSLDKFPETFFDDKISIAMNQMYQSFPKCTFIDTGTSGCAAEVKRDGKAFLGKLIFNLPTDFHSRVQRALRKTDKFYVVYWDRSKGSPQSFFEAVKGIVENKPYVCVSNGTNVHTAMQVALILGARKVTLAGCGAEPIRHEKTGRLQYYSEKYRDKADAFLAIQPKSAKRWKEGVQCLAEACKSYGIEISRYFYDKGYVPVI